MKNIYRMILSILVFSTASSVIADSPLTSTTFSTAYNSEPIVMAAARARGKLTKQIMDFLSDESKPIDIKVACINQLGWDINGKNNAQIFLDYMREKTSAQDTMSYSGDEIGMLNNVIDSTLPYQDPNIAVINRFNSDELLCYAYILALDNYFNVEYAVEYSEMAVQMKPDSYTFCIITAIIQAQHITHKESVVSTNANDCDIFKIFSSIKNDTSLKKDMKEQASTIIFEYMNLYSCN
jgi:hypothetical protein